MARRKSKGRGQLSSIDRLPNEVAPDVAWAIDELLASKRTQADILDEFNERLAAHDIQPVSSSAFNRKALRLAATTARMKETQEITDAIAARLGPDKADNLTVGLVTLLKQAAWEVAETGTLDAESVMFLARSAQSLVSAQKTSADLRRAAQAEIDAKLKRAAKAVDAVGKEKGLSRDTIETIKSRVLGVKLPIQQAPHVPRA